MLVGQAIFKSVNDYNHLYEVCKGGEGKVRPLSEKVEDKTVTEQKCVYDPNITPLLVYYDEKSCLFKWVGAKEIEMCAHGTMDLLR